MKVYCNFFIVFHVTCLLAKMKQFISAMKILLKTSACRKIAGNDMAAFHFAGFKDHSKIKVTLLQYIHGNL